MQSSMFFAEEYYKLSCFTIRQAQSIFILSVAQTFLSAGAGDFPVASSEHGTGKSREPAGWKACAT
jgi:hypothetical protein